MPLPSSAKTIRLSFFMMVTFSVLLLIIYSVLILKVDIEPKLEFEIINSDSYSNTCYLKFSIFDFNSVSFIWDNDFTFNKANSNLYNELYTHECYTPHYDESLIYIASISLGFHSDPDQEMFSSFDGCKSVSVCFEFESYFISKWSDFLNTKYTKSNKKFLFFFTYTYLQSPKLNNNYLDRYHYNNIGRLSSDSYHYHFNELDISLPCITKTSYLQNDIIFNKTYIFSFRGTFRSYDSWTFLDKRYNKAPLLRMRYLRATIDKVLNGNDNDIQFIYEMYRNEDRRNIPFNKERYNYEMQNSIFCLVISGDEIWSFRFMEVLSSGCIPIVIANGWVLPFDAIINWNHYVIIINEILFYNKSINNANDFIHYIYDKSNYNYLLIQKYNNNISNWFIHIKLLYKKYFSNDKVMINYMIQSIFKKIKNQRNKIQQNYIF